MSTLPKENEMPRCDSIEDVIQNFGDLHELAAEMDSFRELAMSVESRRSELLSELLHVNHFAGCVSSFCRLCSLSDC